MTNDVNGNSGSSHCSTPVKPLGRKAYGSIGHLPNSRLGPKDHCITEGQARIATVKARDKHDTIVVQEKLDGSCCAVALVDGEIHAIGRAGWPAQSSRFEQHQLFAHWVRQNENRFRDVLRDGERIVGEWLAQAHGTIYDLTGREPFAAFDIMTGTERITYQEFRARACVAFDVPHTLHVGKPISVEDAMSLHRETQCPCDEPEGVVYRVERKGKVDYLCKWVRPDKIDGKLLPEISGCDPVWNWRP